MSYEMKLFQKSKNQINTGSKKLLIRLKFENIKFSLLRVFPNYLNHGTPFLYGVFIGTIVIPSKSISAHRDHCRALTTVRYAVQ